jgi:sulfite reductase (NADPH) flavoprotein alpha-component
MSMSFSITIKKEEAMSYSKTSPFLSKITGKSTLVKQGSSKHTYHLEIDIKESGITYNPGDSVAIFPQNNPALVEHLLRTLGASGDELIHDSRSGQSLQIKAFLTYKANLSRLTSSFLKLLFEKNQAGTFQTTLENLLQKENKELLMDYLSSHHPVDVLKEYGSTSLPLQEICSQFGPLLPRFYSISSSQKAHPDEIHLTVALFSYAHCGEQRFGVASHFLCHLAEQDMTDIPLYIQPSHSFSLPDDTNTPIIMVGPGTGVAPFRAFLQERMCQKAQGKNWLFFGERNKDSDFLYGEYFEQLAEENKLRLDLAFSRDQNAKIYVQHKMLDSSKDLWEWLQEGAFFYVCGDAQRMAKDVELALHTIAIKEGNLSEEEAKAYVKSLKTTKRYRTDIY